MCDAKKMTAREKVAILHVASLPSKINLIAAHLTRQWGLLNSSFTVNGLPDAYLQR